MSSFTKSTSNNKRAPSRDKPVQTRQGRLNSGDTSPFKQFSTPQRKHSAASNSSELFELNEASLSRFGRDLPAIPSRKSVKLETVYSASVSPDGSPIPRKIDPLSENVMDFLFEMSKSGGQRGSQSGEPTIASDVLYVCSTSAFSS